MADSNEPLWARQARQWSLVGSPLRPNAEDLELCQAAIDGWRQTHEATPRALILGVTPELATLRWPPGTTVVGTDLSFPMIRVVWPGSAAGDSVHRVAAQTNWGSLPLADGACDLGLCDGSFSAVDRAAQTSVRRSVWRVLKPRATVLLRAYIRPDERETPDDVWEDLVAGRIGNFHAFKLRLLMAVCQPNGDARVADAWRFFDARCSSFDELARCVGWPVEVIRTIEAYNGQATAYWFPSLAEFRAEMADAFEEVACSWPSYELGERCPAFTLLRRDGAAPGA
jgi:SAM-dependent methyltransferase